MYVSRNEAENRFLMARNVLHTAQLRVWVCTAVSVCVCGIYTCVTVTEGRKGRHVKKQTVVVVIFIFLLLFVRVPVETHLNLK